ncbi:hypothetical protein [Methylobacterium sp.]|uniref:hypothetical protein n=1 Tax=Methylobacterium sp. TaxID=409 RepID=UPI0025E63376|nr:hypothetical protein [Methylobacterium sp.]
MLPRDDPRPPLDCDPGADAMRDNLILLSAAMVGGLVTMASAQAQQRPGWVDPPARTDMPKAEAPRTEGPKATETSKADALRSVPANAKEAAKGEAAQGPRAVTARQSGESGFGDRMVRRRLSETPAMSRRGRSAASPHRVIAPAPAVDDSRFVDWAGRAQQLTFEYVDSISAPNAVTLAAAPRFYAQRVRRFGKVEGLEAVMADKRRFNQRWPDRRYAIRSGTTQTACNAAQMSCVVRTTLDYRAQNPARGARSQGVAELVLEISFTADRPLIVSESSRVLSRAASASLVDARAKPGA